MLLPTLVRRVALAATLVVAAAMASPGVARPALAVGQDALCSPPNSTFTVTLSQAVTSVPANVMYTIESSYSCTVGPASGTSTITNTQSVGCSNLLTAFRTQLETITWTGVDDPKTSTVNYTSVQTTANGARWTGTVTAGRFTGDGVTKVWVIDAASPSVASALLCFAGNSTGSVSGISGDATLTLTQP
jgi:hypothetical protein